MNRHSWTPKRKAWPWFRPYRLLDVARAVVERPQGSEWEGIKWFGRPGRYPFPNYPPSAATAGTFHASRVSMHSKPRHGYGECGRGLSVVERFWCLPARTNAFCWAHVGVGICHVAKLPISVGVVVQLLRLAVGGTSVRRQSILDHVR